MDAKAQAEAAPVYFAVCNTRHYGWQAERTDEAIERARPARERLRQSARSPVSQPGEPFFPASP